jgi:hypothetical protein
MVHTTFRLLISETGERVFTAADSERILAIVRARTAEAWRAHDALLIKVPKDDM